MSYFDSGVKGYVYATATIYMQFPIDHRNVAHVNCKSCWYYRPTGEICGLTKKPVLFPDKYVGDECPFMPIEIENEEENDGVSNAERE